MNAKIIPTGRFEYFQHLWKLLAANYIDFDTFMGACVYITHSPLEKDIADCLKLALKLCDVQSLSLERHQKQRSRFYPCHILISIVPRNYGKILSEDNEFRKELRYLVRNQSCTLFLASLGSAYNPSIRVLVNSLNEVSVRPIQMLDLGEIYQVLSNSAIKVVDTIMTQQFFSANDSVTSIMTGKELLLSVYKASSVSDAYLLMEESGKRHCPVIDEETGKFSRMISRGDIYTKIPPMPGTIPDDIKNKAGLKLDSNAANKELMSFVNKTVNDVFPGDTQNIMCLNNSDTIEGALKKFIDKSEVLDSKGQKIKMYFTALPVLDSSGRIEGIVSFIDVLKKFIHGESTFLDKKIVQLATMSDKYQEPENIPGKVTKTELIKLTPKSTFSNAKTLMKVTGFRSLPVVDVIKGKEGEKDKDRLIGFVDDTQIKRYSHNEFFGSLLNLPVTYFMTKVQNLHKPEPEDLLADLIEKFWTLDANCSLPSSFAVCEGDNLVGVISYIDILTKWCLLHN
jgi:CBS domain-containing protein